MAETSKPICVTCTRSLWCPTWAEVKCKALMKRVHGYKTLTECKYYKKRGKDFKEPKCQCEDCLKYFDANGEININCWRGFLSTGNARVEIYLEKTNELITSLDFTIID